MAKATITCLILPAPIPLRRPYGGQVLQGGFVGDLDGNTLHHHVLTSVPAVAPGHENHVRVVLQVHDLLLTRTCSEMDRSVEPDGNQRTHVRTAVTADGAD